jgi:hypothetical protein
MSKSEKTSWKRRPPPPRWLGIPLGALVLGVYWPITKLFPSWWPGFVGRTVTKVLREFPKTFEPGERDVLICSYYKSGTNWTIQIAVQIAHRGRAEFEHIHDLVPWPDMSRRAGYAVPLDVEPQRRASTGHRIIKTHLAIDDLPYSRAARYICVVRDAKDVFVSSYHFTRAMVLGPLMRSVGRWLDTFLSNDAPIGSWARHLASGWRLRDAGNVLFLTYDGMCADLGAAVDKIAAFMGVQLTPEERAAVVERSSVRLHEEDRAQVRGAGRALGEFDGLDDAPRRERRVGRADHARPAAAYRRRLACRARAYRLRLSLRRRVQRPEPDLRFSATMRR